MAVPTQATCDGITRQRAAHSDSTTARRESAPTVGACRVCGCTELRACPGGCWWIEPDLCSACKEAGV